jgi:hypothetical protein
MQSLTLSGKQVLITGATNGIGLAAAEALAARGADVAIVGRNETRAKIAAAPVRTVRISCAGVSFPTGPRRSRQSSNRSTRRPSGCLRRFRHARSSVWCSAKTRRSVWEPDTPPRVSPAHENGEARMARYLNELIKAVEKEAEVQREQLDRLERQNSTKGSRDAAGSLNRVLQRLAVLEALRERDRHRPRRRYHH